LSQRAGQLLWRRQLEGAFDLLLGLHPDDPLLSSDGTGRCSAPLSAWRTASTRLSRTFCL
jgi:hypothetical protein